MQFERLFQVQEGLLFRSALAGHIHLDALGDIPIRFPPDTRREGALHDSDTGMGRRPGGVPTRLLPRAALLLSRAALLQHRGYVPTRLLSRAALLQQSPD